MSIDVIFILGMHRSGTSALARALNLLELPIAKDLVGPNDSNALGYWESKRIVRFNDRLFASADRNWADPRPMPEEWFQSAGVDSRIDEAAKLLRNEFAGLKQIVIKDPRLSRLMPLWRKALQKCDDAEALCLIMCRNPLEVCQSLNRRDGLSRDHALRLWLSYLLDAEFGTRGLARAVVHYEALLADWRLTLRTACAAMGLRPPDSIESHGRAVDAFINESHRHHAIAAAGLMTNADVSETVKSAYALVALDPALASEAEFDQLRRDWRKEWEKISPGDQASSFARAVPEWHFQRSDRLEKEGRLDEAVHTANRAVELLPQRAASHHRLSGLLARNNRLQDAEAALRRAIALDANSSLYRIELSLILERTGRIAEAIEAQEQAVQRESGAAQLHHRLGNLLVKAGRFEEAAAAQRRAIELHDGAPRFHSGLSNALEHQGCVDQAIEAQERAVQKGPGVAQHHHRLGNLLSKAGRFEEAAAAQRRAIELDAETPWFHNGLSHALEQLGHLDEAIEAQKRAVQKRPGGAQLRRRLGHLLSRTGRYEEAAAVQDEAMSLARNALSLDTGPAADNGPRLQAACELLALTSAQWWARDAERLIGSGTGSRRGDATWPLGRAIPKVEPMVRRPVDATRSGPRLSIMLPVYDVEEPSWLNRCLDSVLSEDRGPDWAEIVVVDDASVNSTARSIAQSHGPRVTYRCNERNLGIVGNHNACIALAAGEFIHILHQDDWIEPGFYQALIEPMTRDPSLVAAYSNFRFVNAKGQPVRRQPLERPQAAPMANLLVRLAHGQAIQFAAMIVRRSTYLALGGFSPLSIYAFDRQMWGRIAALGPVWYEPRCLASFRSHPHSATSAIAPLDRLLDAMRVEMNMMLDLPPDARGSVARTAFTDIFLDHLSSQVNAPKKAAPAERNRLFDFLLTAVSDEQDKAMLAAALKPSAKA